MKSKSTLTHPNFPNWTITIQSPDTDYLTWIKQFNKLLHLFTMLCFEREE
jgi:hypothetical protein